jgi:hypothetical protein
LNVENLGKYRNITGTLMIMMHFGRKQIVTTVLWHRNEFPWGKASDLGHIGGKKASSIKKSFLLMDDGGLKVICSHLRCFYW